MAKPKNLPAPKVNTPEKVKKADDKKGKAVKDEKQTKVNARANNTSHPADVPLEYSFDVTQSDTSKMARTRADVDVYVSPKLNSGKLDDRYPTDCLVEILEDQNGWHKIKPVLIQHAVAGYVPHEALVFAEAERKPVFPNIQSASGAVVGQAVPPATKLKDFQAWQSKGGKPDWIEKTAWDSLDSAGQADLAAGMLGSLQANQAGWEKWVAAVTADNRLDDAEMNEWIVTVNGGSERYAIRDHYIYKAPVQNGSYYGCALKGQIMRWNGNVRFSEEDGKRINFYEVTFYRMSLPMTGWFRADISTEYVYPSSKNDPQIQPNAKTVFDLSQNILRHPQDSQISPTKKKGLDGAQYIDIFEATKSHLVHWCLCGEFCVAALSGSDIIPLLTKWIDSKYTDVHNILNDPHMGTGITDLKSILKLFSLDCETYTSIPTTPQRIKERLNSGQFVLAGCGINKVGELIPDGSIRHWVVIDDILPVGNSGWVRVYNPFFNQDEVYEYNLFMKSCGVGAGLWISPKP